ncbi:MAG TPA: TetR family transcriptional regulator C-terminal domain-containing protein [Nocardioidaceae bacterium]|nr:TetR family transcriptional regulator C-terminal domain-containing protein [Nocardioidaceae bacterium]
MTSRVQQKVRVRRSAEDRRAEIVSAATRLALSQGLDQVTLRSVAEELDVVGSLVSHYFPSVDQLLAEAFAGAAQAELDEVFAEVEAIETPRDALARLLRRLVDEERDAISTLWVDAWHAGRRRPAVNEKVAEYTEAWNARLASLIERGGFDTDSRRSAARIMAVVDGLTVQAVIRGTIDYEAVEELVFSVAETELGLRRGTLG